MQLRILKDPAVTWPVKVAVPADEGKVEDVSIKVRLRLLQDSTLKDDMAAIGLALAMPNGAGITEALVNQAALTLGDKVEEHVLGWEGVVQEDGAPMPFTPENRKAVLNLIFVRRAILGALLRASRGEAAEKN